MNDEHLADDLLQRFADGDLSAAHAASASRHLEQCTQCTQAHTRLQALHRVMNAAAEQSMEGVDFEALYRRIERGTREAPDPGLLERVSLWWRDLIEQKPARLLVPAGAIAVAALTLVSVYGSPEKPKEVVADQKPTAPAENTIPPEPPEEALAMAAVGSEVVQVDFGDGTGTVYEIALADGVSTPVVWINDDE